MVQWGVRRLVSRLFPSLLKSWAWSKTRDLRLLVCWESLSLKLQPGPKFVYEPYIYKPNLWNPPALLFWEGYCVVPLGTRISADMPSRSPAQVPSERVTAWKAERRSLKRIKIGLISKLGTVPVLFVLIHAHFVNIEWWLLFLKVLSTYSFHQCKQFSVLNAHSLRKRPLGHAYWVPCLILPLAGTLSQRFSTAHFS